MNAMGNVMMATGILEAFGVSPEAIAKLRTEWYARPRLMSATARVSINDYMKLRRKAAQEKQRPDDMVTKLVRDYINTIKE